ncbi:MAG: DNA topoisomerase 4 subunit A [Clostridiales bacterium]|jgi:DNA gyrase subunit A|nr:DNA topoisomerase 4 subunit A [Clostridiales bacterium]
MGEENIRQTNERVVVKTMEEVMHESMIPYSEYVILDRALPRVEDGLKPVQRRILYTMHELGITPDKPFRKCARIVGDCLGKFHPHGDTSIYQALVRMAQSFNMGSILVDGHGNFGSIDGDGAAAMRYTEARMTPLALELLRDLEKDTVKWSCNFDDTLNEPDMLPGRFPNLLVNGASGIAVGLATNIPPHNLSEAIDGVIAYIDNPRITLKEMMKSVKGPDFPSGGYIVSDDELVRAYETGRGKIVIRAKMHIETVDYDKKMIVIDELPFQVNKAALLESILKAREEKKDVLTGISDITDESDRNGMRAVIRVKKDADPKAIIEKLFKSTNLSVSYGVNMVAIADGKPQQMGLLDIIAYYVNYQRAVVLRRTRYELEEAKAREHILIGLVIAVKNIDEVVRVIKNSASTGEARENLRKRFELSEIQAQAILDLRLARLTHMEVFKLEKELADIRDLIKRLTAIVESKKLQMDLVKAELLQIKRSYKTDRRTEILKSLADYTVVSDDDEKPVEEYVVAVNAGNQLKRIPQKNYSLALKDFTDNSTKNEICSALVKLKSNERLYCFTNAGNCYKIDPAALPEAKWREKGSLLKAVAPEASENERPVYLRSVGEAVPSGKLLFYTREGMVKRSDWSEYNVVKSAFAATKLKDGDEVIAIEDEIPSATLLFITKDGMCLNADMTDIPVQGRVASGVKGIQLSDGDYCVCVRQATGDGEVVVVSDRGYAKRVLIAQLDVMARYRKGVKIADFKKDNGARVIFASCVKNPYKIVLDVDGEYLTAFSTEALSIENRTHPGRPLLKGKHLLAAVFIYNDTPSNA